MICEFLQISPRWVEQRTGLASGGLRVSVLALDERRPRVHTSYTGSSCLRLPHPIPLKPHGAGVDTRNDNPMEPV